jgi:cytochrome c553
MKMEELVTTCRLRWRVPTAFVGAALVWSVAVAGQASRDDAAVGPARRAFMDKHFSEAINVHDAVARGDLATAQAQASRLAEHRPEVAFPVGAQAFFGLMTIEAGKVRDAPTIEQAGHAAATLLTRCGQCHQAMHVRVGVPVTPEPETGGVVGQMRAHQRAADLMLEGLIGPSPANWTAGARSFGELRFVPGDMPGREIRERARIANAHLLNLAAVAEKAQQPRDRAEVYGRILSACARCHREHPKTWGPAR